MLDDLLSLAVRHYVLAGSVVLALGLLANAIWWFWPERIEEVRLPKLY